MDLFGTMEWTTPPTLETAATSTDNGGGRRRHPQAMPVADDRRMGGARSDPGEGLGAAKSDWVRDFGRVEADVRTEG